MGRIDDNSKKSVIATVFIILAGSTMIAHGLRMMTQGIFFPNSIYPAPVPTTVDFWFDWFILSVLGIIIVVIGMKRWIQWIRRKKQKESSEKKVLFSAT